MITGATLWNVVLDATPIARVAQSPVVLIGGRDELDLAAEVMAAAKAAPLNLVDRLSLTRLGALLQQCQLLVSGDTGPLHLATAVGTRRTPPPPNPAALASPRQRRAPAPLRPSRATRRR